MKVLLFFCLYCLELAAVQRPTKPPKSVPYTLDCRLTKSGREYAGLLNTTYSGRSCQAWTSDQPHFNYYKQSTEYPEGSATEAGNKCRNPDPNYNDGVWCYTTSPRKRWELCNVRFCDCILSNDASGIHYEGQINRARSGQLCRFWSVQTPNRHPYNDSVYFPDRTMSEASNYCRNPNASRPNGPWCYVNATLGWDYCRIPTCNLTAPILPTRPTTPATTTRPPTTSIQTSRPPTISIQTSRPPTTSIQTSRPPTTSIQTSIQTSRPPTTSIQTSIQTSIKTSRPPITSIQTSSAKITSGGTSIASVTMTSSRAKVGTSSTLGRKSTFVTPVPTVLSTKSTTTARPIPKITSFAATSSSSAAEIDAHRSEDDNNSINIVKIVIPVLGVTAIVAIVLVCVVWKRRGAFQQSWKRFSDWIDTPPKPEAAKEAEVTSSEPSDSRPKEGFDNPNYRREQQPIELSGATQDHSSTDSVILQNDLTSAVYKRPSHPSLV